MTINPPILSKTQWEIEVKPYTCPQMTCLLPSKKLYSRQASQKHTQIYKKQNLVQAQNEIVNSDPPINSYVTL